MGFFSWNTSDTKRSIPNTQAEGVQRFPVWMIMPDDSRVEEKSYAGYGVFGDLDFYVEVARHTIGPDLVHDVDEETLRSWGISLEFLGEEPGDNGSGPETLLRKWCQTHAPKDVKRPKFAEDKNAVYKTLPRSKPCRYQGYFYPEKRRGEHVRKYMN